MLKATKTLHQRYKKDSGGFRYPYNLTLLYIFYLQIDTL